MGGFLVPVRCDGLNSVGGIVYHPDKEMAADAKFRENNLIFRVVHEKVIIFASVFINVEKRG